MIKTIMHATKQLNLVRNGLLHDRAIIEVDDFGAGSAVIKKNSRAVNRHSSLFIKAA
jgi:hypothetical protein